MSKVYSFRLDANNPREAQAKEVIDAWVSQGYSLRNQLIDVLLESQNKNFKYKQYVELFEKIERLISNSNEERDVIKVSEGALTETFVGSISKSVKNGIRID